MEQQEIDLRNRELLQLMLSAAAPAVWRQNEKMIADSLADPSFRRPALSKARKALVIGQGTSYATAWNTASYFGRIAGLEAHAITAFECSHYMEDYIKNPEDTLLVGISCGGNTASVAAALKAAREKGAVTVCISGEGNIRCAREAEYRVVTDCGIERRDTYSHPYSVSHLFLLQGAYILSLLIGAQSGYLTAQAKETWEQRLEQAIGSLDMLPGLYDRIVALNKKIRADGGSGHIVLGTGPNRGTMMEGALKISEFSWQLGAAEELEDFAHGRFRELDPATPLFIIAPEGPCSAKTLDLLTGCTISGTTSVVLTDHPTDLVRQMASYVIEMPAVHEYLTPFVYVFAFWFYGYATKSTMDELVGEARYGLYAVDINFETHFRVRGNKS